MTANLADRVEGLDGPNETVDAEVCKAFGILRDVTHYPVSIDGPSYWSGLDEFGNWTPVEPYTASLDAVVALIEKELPGWWFAVGLRPGTPAYGKVVRPSDDGGHEGHGSTPALALFAALLRAKEASRCQP